MTNKTEGAKILAQDVLAARFHEPYGTDVILEVFQAIEHNADWLRRYGELRDDLSRNVVNQWMGHYIKDETGLRSLREVPAGDKSSLITAYTQLG